MLHIQLEKQTKKPQNQQQQKIQQNPTKQTPPKNQTKPNQQTQNQTKQKNLPNSVCKYLFCLCLKPCSQFHSDCSIGTEDW